MNSGSSDRHTAPRGSRTIALAGGLILLALPALGRGLLVSSSEIFATVPAGGNLLRQITLTPTDSRPTLVLVSVEPFAMDADGRPRHGPGMQVPAGHIASVEASPRRLVLENGHPEVLQVRCAPAEAGGSSWAVVLLEVEPVRMRGDDGSMAEVTARVAVPVFVTTEGTQHPGLRVGEMSAALSGPDRIEWQGVLENTGNTVLKVSGVLAIEESDREAAAEDLENVLMLPGFRRRIHGVVAGDFHAGGGILARLWIRFGSEPGNDAAADCAVATSASSSGSDRPRA